MSADQPIEVELAAAVVSFDGRVLEVFGGRDTDRVHVRQITSIEQDKNQYVIDTVRRASPNLEEPS
jgi:hypothetical protein